MDDLINEGKAPDARTVAREAAAKKERKRILRKEIRIATLNVRGLNKVPKQEHLNSVVEKEDLDILVVTETWLSTDVRFFSTSIHEHISYN